MPVDVTTFETKERLLAAMEQTLRETLASPSEVPFAVLISGGNTPLPVYASLAANPPAVSPQAHVAFADDRHVPVDSPENNYGNARNMIAALGIPEEQVLRIHPELPLEAAADRYDRDLAAYLARGGRIPVAFLGLGADGHTCSLFSDADLARCIGRLAAPVYKDSPPNRVTVGPDLLSRVERVIFVAAGSDKMEMIRALVDTPGTITAGKAVAACASVSLWRA